MGFLVFLFIMYLLYKKGVFDIIISQIKEAQQSETEIVPERASKLTIEEQEELKRKIRERSKNLDPKRMPPVAKQFTSEDIELYHDALDECDNDSCDINLGYKNQKFVEDCNLPECDMDKDNVLEDDENQGLSLVHQLVIAEAILYRKGF